MKRMLVVLFVAVSVCPVFPARLVLNQNGAQRVMLLDADDRIEFNAGWTRLYCMHTAAGTADTFDLTVINRISIDTLGGALASMIIETDDGNETIDFASVERIFFEIGEPDYTSDDDGDGLTDYEEKYRYGTNPKNPNTDGDLYDDYQEVHEFGDFWPLIAELPEFSVALETYPTVTMNYTYSSDNSTTQEVVRGEETSVERTDSRTTEVCHSYEHGWESSVTLEQTVEVGTTPGTGWGWGFQVGAHGSYARSTATQTGVENSIGYNRSIERAEARERTDGVVVDGARLETRFRITNEGPFAFDITSLEFELVLDDVDGADIVTGLATGISELNRITLNPGATVYRDGTLDLDLITAQAVRRQIADADFMYGRLGTYGITYNGASVNQATTQSYSNCATVIIDFGAASGLDPVIRKVAAMVNYNPHGSLDYSPLILKEALEAVRTEFKGKTGLNKDLWWEYGRYNGNFGLSAMGIDGDTVQTDPDRDGFWYILLERDGADVTRGYSIKRNSLFPDTLALGVKDFIHIVYSADADGDSLANYEEALYGTSDDDRDSDDDGLSDYTEVRGFTVAGSGGSTVYQTDPMLWDTDGDSVGDGEDDNPLQHPGAVLDSVAGIDSLLFTASGGGAAVAAAAGADTAALTLPAGNTAGTLTILTEQRVSKVDVYGPGAMPVPVSAGADARHWSAALAVAGINETYSVVVTSEDGRSRDTAVVEISAPLGDGTVIETVTVNRQKPWRMLDVKIDNAGQDDARTTGVLLLRSQDSLVLAGFTPGDGNNDIHTVGTRYETGGTYGVFLLRDAPVSLSSETVTDTLVLQPGRRYYYRQLPYHTDGLNRHWYAAGGPVYEGTATRRVRLRVKFEEYRMINPADGVGGAEIYHELKGILHDASGAHETVVSTYFRENFDEGESFTFSDDNHRKEFYPDRGEEFEVRLLLKEDDGGSGDDYIWSSGSGNDLIFPEGGQDAGRYSLEYLGDIAVNGGATGWTEHTNSTYTFNGKYYENSYQDSQMENSTEVWVHIYIQTAIVY